MKRITLPMLAAVLMAVGAASAFAGGEECDKKAKAAVKAAKADCGKSAEECLSAMAAKIQSKGWLGFETEKTAEGHYKVVEVANYSPAQKAGFQKGDILVALNGASLYAEDKSELKKIKSSLAVGSKVTYTVKRDGQKEVVEATLVEVPQQVMAQWIGEHMLDQHAHIEVASS
jgi:predicted metalloprotease with PDZ domain